MIPLAPGGESPTNSSQAGHATEVGSTSRSLKGMPEPWDMADSTL